MALAAPSKTSAGPAPRMLETVDEIDAAWLGAALRHGGYEDAQVNAFTVTPIGAGNVSSTVRVDLEGAGEGPAAVVCKFRPRDPGSHQHGVASRAYSCEAGAYRRLSSLADGCRIPRLLWLDGDEDNINLVVEDLTRSTRPGDQVCGCGADDAGAVMIELARLHRTSPLPSEVAAPSWALRMPECGAYWGPAIATGAEAIAARYANRMSSADLALVRAAAGLASVWHNLSLDRAALTHGDPRVDNVLFRDGPGGIEAVLIDWQVAGRRNPMHDVGYFLSGSLSVADRRAHEHGLIGQYADVLGDGNPYSHAQMLEDYRLHIVSGLMITTAAVAVLPDTPTVARLILALLQRNCAAVADWDTLAAIRAAA